jgi:hypothetical protein
VRKDAPATDAAGSGTTGTTGTDAGGTTGATGTAGAAGTTGAAETTGAAGTTGAAETTGGVTGGADTEAAGGESDPGMRGGMQGMRFANGFNVGIHGGANFPQNRINDFYEPGLNVGGHLGWDPIGSPLGLRLNLSWNRLNGRDIANTTINNIRYEADLANADLYSGFADAKVRLPIFGRSNLLSGLYAVGGAGVTYFRNFNQFGATTGTTGGQSVIRTFNAEDVTRFALNGGGGLSWGIGGVALFVEGRYVRVFTANQDTDYVPVTIGLSFH